ncbi:MAG: dihydrodipicolinate reductase [Fibrobacterota bacterium]
MKLMVNGLPGSMAGNVIHAAQKRGIEVIPYSLTGPGMDSVAPFDGREYRLVLPDERDGVIEEIKGQYGPFISVDYTHPTAVNENAAFYVRHDLPFVMGTTGGDRDDLRDTVDRAGLYAVIAPNMAKQIVALQNMLETASRDFPDLYQGYQLSVTESHQKTKADTSGTAKAVVATFNEMGIEPFETGDITQIRSEKQAKTQMGVPDEYMQGHAFHTYRLTSPDGTVAFEYRHNVCGRSIYAEGTVDAVQFLAEMIAKKSKQKRFNMIDVLKSGAMQ